MIYISFLIGVIIGTIITTILHFSHKTFGELEINRNGDVCRLKLNSKEISNKNKKKVVLKIIHISHE